MSGCAAEVPRVDVLKEEQQFTLIADLPGFTKKDVDVKVSNVSAPVLANLQAVACGCFQHLGLANAVEELHHNCTVQAISKPILMCLMRACL